MTAGRMPESSFALPGGVLLGNQPSECRHVNHAVLRPLSGYEEEWMAQSRGTPSAVVTTRLLNACMVRLDDDLPSPDAARQMLVGDRDFLMLQLRRLTLGERIHAVVECPACAAKMDVEFQASELEGQPRSLREAWNELQLSSRTIRFRLPTGADQEGVAGLQIDEAERRLLAFCVSGSGDLTEAERDAVIAEMDKLAPQLDGELDLTCPDCVHEFVQHFDVSRFFFDEMRINSGQLLREVHTLAFYYHWSESEILSLTRGRRRAYLSLLHDALREE